MITRDQAIASYHGQVFHHVSEKNADGTPLRAHVNGQCKTWKTRPLEFRLPMKHGLYDCFYLTPFNQDEWSDPHGD